MGAGSIHRIVGDALGRSLAKHYDDLIVAATTADLIDDGSPHRRRVPPFWALGDKVCLSKLKSPEPIGETHAVVAGMPPVVVFCTASDEAVAANAQPTALGLFREAEGLWTFLPSLGDDLRHDLIRVLGGLAALEAQCEGEHESAAALLGRTPGIDPLLPFKICPMNGREARESGPPLNEGVA